MEALFYDEVLVLASRGLAFLRVLAQPSGRTLASRLAGVVVFALLHLAVQPRGLLRVLVVPIAPLCVRLAKNAARVFRPQRGRHTNHGDPANVAGLDALSVYVGSSTRSEGRT